MHFRAYSSHPSPYRADYRCDMRDHAFHLQLAGRLRRRRKELGLKQVDLADLAGCSTRFVHAAEAGKPTLRLDKLLELLAVLGLQLQVEPIEREARARQP